MAGASIQTARVETPSASSSSSSPGRRELASASVAPQVRTGRRSRREYSEHSPANTNRARSGLTNRVWNQPAPKAKSLQPLDARDQRAVEAVDSNALELGDT